ncbi:MAG TPA: hypothetical protein P5123_05145, partial [Spirochaetota bacterium]|nr:hypothetical protein [Spirochaetota bacterium]
MNRKVVCLFIILLSFFSCSRTDYFDFLSARSVKSFSFAAADNGLDGFDIDAVYDKSSLSFVAVFPKDTLPPSGTGMRLVPSFEIDGYALYVDGKRQSSGLDGLDFTDKQSYTYKLYSYDGKSTDYTVTAQNAAAWFESFGFAASDNAILSSTFYNIGDIMVPEDDIEGNAIWFDLPHTVSLDGLVPTFTTSPSDVKVFFVDKNGKEHANVTAPRDFSDYCVYRVYDNRNESYLDYRVSALRLKILSFKNYPEIEACLIDHDMSDNINDVFVQLPYNADLRALVPVFDVSGENVLFYASDGERVDAVSGETSLDFSDPVRIVVKSRAGKSKEYRIVVSRTESPDIEPYNPPNNPAKPDGSGNESGEPIVPPTGFTLGYNANGGSGSLPARRSYSPGDSIIL